MTVIKKFTTLLLLATMCIAGGSCKNGSNSSDSLNESESTYQPASSENSESSENTYMPDSLDKEFLADTLESKHTLKFDENGQFKVLVFSDLHLKTGGIPAVMDASIKKLVDREDPDLIILNGDNIQDTEIQSRATMRAVVNEAVDYIEERQIPWMHVFGNHDSESGFSRLEQQRVYEGFEYCISKAGEKSLTGVGNYVIPVYGSNDDTVKFTVWGLDSGDYLSAEDKEGLFPLHSAFNGYRDIVYNYIHYDQIEWYVKISKLLQEQNDGKIVPGLMSFHIPLQEFYTAWINRESLTWNGEKREVIAASPHNSGLFNALYSRGDIKAVVSGHDHKNNFMVEYGGIKLCYASTVSTNTYHDADIHGARVFVVNEDDPSNVETYISYVAETIEDENVGTIESGHTYDFESAAPTLTLSSWPNDTSPGVYPEEISAQVFDGVGRNGSKGLGVTRQKYHEDNGGRNIEVKWDDASYGKLGENKYLMVWMDLAANELDFRKSCFGLLREYNNTAPYATDNYDTPSSFYYKADGSDTWVEQKTGSDGCIGEADNSSVKNYKGWFAFPIENMLQSGSGAQLTSESIITGYYFYLSLATEAMTGKYVYIDDVTLVKDYKTY